MPSQMPSQEDVDHLLRKKRKAREHKACYPCRQRKVRCDLSQPCQTCRARDHPELCSYHPPEKRCKAENVAASYPDEQQYSNPPSANLTVSRDDFEMLCRKIDGLQTSIDDMRTELNNHVHGDDPSMLPRSDSGNGTSSPQDESVPAAVTTTTRPTSQPSSRPSSPAPRHYDVHGLHTTNDAGQIVHFGGSSVPALLYHISQTLGQPNTNDSDTNTDEYNAHQLRLQEALGKSVLPLFGLDNESATYPFVDLWGLPPASRQRAEHLTRTLPNDEQLMKLWTSYRDLAFTIYPGIVDIHDFEKKIKIFIRDRAAQQNDPDGVTESAAYGHNYRWIGMLFAVLASGAQCSALPRRERELTSQVYVCCGFECLRFTNFLSQPHMESIQTLLLIGNVMTNNMNAGSAWSLMGLTIRLAQGLGLHRCCPPNVTDDIVLPRSKVWWAIVWADSLMSVTYDRATCIAMGVPTIPMPQNFGEIDPYHQSMYRLARAGLELIHERRQLVHEVKPECLTGIESHRVKIVNIVDESAEHIRDINKCRTHTDKLQHYGLYLHYSYLLSELYRPSISSTAQCNSDVIHGFRRSCIHHLANVVDAYLHLDAISSFTRQSWAAVHRSLSSALLLGILGEHVHNERARTLIGRFIAAMAELTDPTDPREQMQEVSAPMQRGLAALRKLNIEACPREAAHDDGCQQKRQEQAALLRRDAAQKLDAVDSWAVPRGQKGTCDSGWLNVFSPSTTTSMSKSASTASGGSSVGKETEESSPSVVLNQILWGHERYSD